MFRLRTSLTSTGLILRKKLFMVRDLVLLAEMAEPKNIRVTLYRASPEQLRVEASVETAPVTHTVVQHRLGVH